MKHEIDLCPFIVPNFVRQKPPQKSRQEGFTESPPIALSELSIQTLEELCSQFREGVMRKAGKI